MMKAHILEMLKLSQSANKEEKWHRKRWINCKLFVMSMT
jgi:hypothetical protein